MREIACQLAKIASIVFASHHLKRKVTRQIALYIVAPRTGADAWIPVIKITKRQIEACARLSNRFERRCGMGCLCIITRGRKGKTPSSGMSRCACSEQKYVSNDKHQDKNGTKRNKGW